MIEWPSDPSRLTPTKEGPPKSWTDLLEKIDSQVTHLAADRLTWRTARDVALKSASVNEQPYFFNWVTDLYSRSMALGVRKLSDRDPRTASFSNLMESMATEPELLTREWFSSGVMEGLVSSIDAGFTRVADPRGLGHLDPEVVRADQQQLASAANGIKHYVDQHIAHFDASPSAPIPSYKDLDDAVDLLCELLRKYVYLLTRGDRIQCEPVFQMPWNRVFDTAWASEFAGASEDTGVDER